MNKTLLALALLGTFAGAASAQSNVTVYGKVDLGFSKALGTSAKGIADASGSRLGFRGTEDLGNGLSALFGFEHRFDPDTGAANKSATFWQGYSTVGLKGAFGTVNIGRQYVPAFSLIQNQIDPFAGNTPVGRLRDVGMRPGGITKVRTAGSIRYDFSANGFNVAASLAEGDKNGGPDKPFSIAGNYSAGPLFVGVGYEDPAGDTDRIVSAGARYKLGFATVSAGLSTGTTAANLKARGYMVGAAVPLGAANLYTGFAQQKVDGVTTNQKFGLGYDYKLSKWTMLYADFGNDSKLASNKSGYDLGIQHNF